MMHMSTLDIIQLINSKVFHDLGNSITTLGLLDSSQQDFQKNIIDDLMCRFKLLRQAFVGMESDNSFASCSTALSQYFKSKKVTINDFRTQNIIDVHSEIYQLFMNLIMCLGAAISYYGDIQVDVDDHACTIEAKGKGIVNNSIQYIINDQLDNIEMTANNIQGYFMLLLAKKNSLKINCVYSNNTFNITLPLRG